MRSAARRQTHIETSGQAIVEFALASLLFLTTLLALFEGGRVVVGYAILTNAVQEGGRAAALPPPATKTDADVCDRVDDESPLIAVTCLSVAVHDTAGATKSFANRTTGDRVDVTGQYQFHPVVASLFGGRTVITLSHTASFTVE
jgi:Flp pilus assembly protein TadG